MMSPRAPDAVATESADRAAFDRRDRGLGSLPQLVGDAFARWQLDAATSCR